MHHEQALAKPKRKPLKRRPKEDRLILTEDPQTALDRLLKKPH